MGVFMKVIVPIVLAAVLGAAGCSATSTDDSYDVQRVCHDFVKDRLKAPSTADFNDDSTDQEGGQWVNAGSVDSENGFGAKLRSTYTCTVHLSGDYWKLDNLDLNDGGAF